MTQAGGSVLKLRTVQAMFVFTCAAIAACAVAPRPAFAEDPVGHSDKASTASDGHEAPHTEKDGDHGGGHAAATPNLFGGDIGNALWTFIIFMVLLVVLGKTAWGPIVTALQKREAFVLEALAKAKQERDQAETLLKQYKEQLDKARQEATAIVEEGRRDADVVRKRIENEAKGSADEMIARAKREIGIARDDAIKALYEQTLELSTEVASKILGRTISDDDHRKLLDDSIREMAQSKS